MEYIFPVWMLTVITFSMGVFFGAVIKDILD